MSAGKAVAIDVEAEPIAADDEAWARGNLRFDDGRLLLDLANCLRVLERHPDYQGRFRFNDVLCKVLDRGTVMIEWRISDMTAELQERFLPEIPFDIVARALVIAANRSGQK